MDQRKNPRKTQQPPPRLASPMSYARLSLAARPCEWKTDGETEADRLQAHGGQTSWYVPQRMYNVSWMFRDGETKK